MIEKDYYVGLDMGTSSVGWAVTDENYKLLRAKGKDLWGVRLFPEASTAADRRNFRTSRRRRQREKARIGYLRELFADVINDIDSGFYQRLDDSKFVEGDKVEAQPFAIFADSNYTDVDYYNDYPTIFHLRKALATMDEGEAYDVRLVFLAVLNIFKHRGHFLNYNLKGNAVGEIDDDIMALCDALYEYNEVVLDGKIIEIIKDILPSKDYSNSKKYELILGQAGIDKKKDKQLAESIKLICGLKGTIKTVFPEETIEEEQIKFSLSFKDGNYEENEITAEQILSEEAFSILMILKNIYDWSILANLMKGEDKTYRFISEARVDLYDKHKNDLNMLKNIIKTYVPDEYSKMFRIMNAGNYSAYVGSVNSGREKARRTEKAKSADLYSTVKSVLKNVPECEEKAYILSEIEKDSLLPKQMTSANGVIPYQLHLAELDAILKNAEQYLDFLKTVDESGLTVSQRIIEVFKFQIPYYIGPLVNNGSGTAWVERKESGRVFPWNFSEKIDEAKSAEVFIQNMVKHCTYISNETVLPKNSLLYEKFMVLNELNNLNVNGEKIPVELKQDIYHELFRRGKKVKASSVEKFLKINGYIDKNEIVEISGIDGDFTNTLSTYAKFASILNTDILTYDEEKMAEQIIFWATVYGDSRKFLESKIREAYGDVLDAKQLKMILGMKFKDWGRLSREFLQIEGADKTNGEVCSIIARMWNENVNLMQILSSDYTYAEEVSKKASSVDKTLTEFEYEDLDGMYMSAPVKRMTWQTILILKELIGVLGKEPKRLFVEMARGAEDTGRKDSRKQKLENLYKGCKVDGRNWSKEIKDTEDSRFKSKKLYLYYTQQGRCMYTGEPIDLGDLFNDNLYDIDHIYPRHFTKDDSLENNLVLVKKQDNAHKSDEYPIEASVRRDRAEFWKMLKDGKFISSEKYNRLIRNTELSEDERAAFINRQLVETRQGTKLITTLLENASGNTEIVYVKAGNVSQFRQKFNLVKNRDINDLHHANDAYLNIVVGNTYLVKFTRNPRNFIRDYMRNPKDNAYHMYKLFEYDVKRGSETAWIAKDGASIAVVKAMMKKNTPLVTRMNYEAHGGLYDQQIVNAKAAEKAHGVGYLPIKSEDERLHNVEQYGGYRKYLGSYFFLVEHTVKGKRIRSLEAMPLYLKHKLDTVEKMEEYCRDILEYNEPVIRLKKIKMYSKIKVNGFPMYLTGRTEDRLIVNSAVEMILDYDQAKYLKNPEYAYDESEAREMNNGIYEILTDKYLKSIYRNRPNPVGEKLVTGKEKFESLGINEQIYVIHQILTLSESNQGADLTLIGESKKTGTMKLNKKISDNDEFILVNESVTGLYVNPVDLLSV